MKSSAKSSIAYYLVAAGISAVLLAGTTILVYYAGGSSNVAVNFYYIPILVSAVAFGDLGAILCATLAAFLCGPYMPQSFSEAGPVPQSFFDQGLRLLFFFIVGVIVSRLTASARRRANEFRSLYHVALAVNSSVRLDRVLKLIVESVRTIMRVKGVAIRLLREDDEGVEELSEPISEGLSSDYIGKGPIRIGDSPIDQKALAGEITKIEDLERSNEVQYPEAMLSEGVRSLLCVPLVSRGRTIGVFRIYREQPHRHSPDELRLVRAFAEEAAVAIENAGLFETLQDSYYETVRSLTRTIEARDPDQLGHAERVTEAMRLLAREIGLGRDEIELLCFGATLHDIGKIGPTDTMDLDLELGFLGGVVDRGDDPEVQLHPLVGASILEPVKFLAPVISVVSCHHENFDGSGYPEGLKGEDIPLYGRLARIANAHDRFLSQVKGHTATPICDAIDHFKAHAGTYYDPELVKPFVRVLKRLAKEVGESPSPDEADDEG